MYDCGYKDLVKIFCYDNCNWLKLKKLVIM